MTNALRSSGIAALSFTLSAGLLALALTPAMASAATVTSVAPVEITVTGDRSVSSRRVATADLGLTSESAMKRLDARIRGASATAVLAAR